MWIRSILIFIIGLVICLPALWPLTKPTFFHLHDFTHVARLVELDRALNDGHFPVRWSRNLGYGYGLPQFNFYGPLPYYIADIYYRIGFDPVTSIKLLIATNFIVSFMALYYLAATFFGPSGGLISATLFTFAPYRAVNAYVRGPLGELTAITFITLTLWFSYAFIKTKKSRYLGLMALSWGAIIVSHNITGMISFPFIVLWMLMWLILEKTSWKNWLMTGMGMIVGLGSSAFYAMPAFMEKGYTQVDKLTQEFSDYHHHFLYLRQFIVSKWGYGGSIFGLYDDVSFEIGRLHLILVIAALMYFLFRYHKERRKQRWLMTYAVLGTGAAVLLSTFKTQFIWENIPFMAYIQFPWRFLSIIMILTSLMGGAAGLWLTSFWKSQTSIKTILILFLIIWFYLPIFKPEKHLDTNEGLYYTDAGRIQREMSGIIPDFIPKIEAKLPLVPPNNRFEISPATTAYKAEVDRTHEFLLKIEPRQASNLLVNIFYFPGWKLYLNGREIIPQVDPLLGTMSVVIPESSGEVFVSGFFSETPIRKIGNTISLMGILIIIYWLVNGPLWTKRSTR